MKNKLKQSGFIGIVLITMIFISYIVIINTNWIKNKEWILLIITSLLYVSFWLIIIAVYYTIKSKRIFLSGSFNYYVERLVANTGVGLVVYNDSSEIIWVSEFIGQRFSTTILGKKVSEFSEEFSKKYASGQDKFRFNYGEIVYDVQVKSDNGVIILKDVTNEDMIINQYNSERLVMGELEIDNYQQFQVMLSEEEMFQIKSAVIKMLDSLVEEYNIVYREYVNGKFIIVTNQEVLDSLKEKKFEFLNNIRNIKVIDNIKLSVSMGFGGGSSLNKELVDLAKEGLLQAQARGGDQVCVSLANRHPSYYGSKTELASSISRVKIRRVTEILESKLSNKNYKKVIIYGHKYADLDAVGAALGVYEIAKVFDKDVYIQNATFDNTTLRTMQKYLPKEMNSIFIKPAKANRLSSPTDTIVVIVDTSDMSIIENPNAFKNIDSNNIFIFDHHRVKSLPSNVPTQQTYIDPSASSTAEIIAEIFMFIKTKIKPRRAVAQMLLNGIYLDTVQFKKTTTSRTFEAASFLGTNGADSKIASEILKLTEESSQLIRKINATLIEVKSGHFLASYSGDVKGDIVSQAADEILRTQGRKASYVIAKVPGEKKFKLSARSVNANVQVVAEKVGGGGHYSASAAISDEPINVFTDNVIQAIIDSGDDK